MNVVPRRETNYSIKSLNKKGNCTLLRFIRDEIEKMAFTGNSSSIQGGNTTQNARYTTIAMCRTYEIFIKYHHMCTYMYKP